MNPKAQHLIFGKDNNYTDNPLSFSKFFRSKLKEFNDNNSCNLSQDDIATQLGISLTLMPKYIANGDKATKKRDCVIAMCLMVHMSVDEINIALSKYGMPYFDEANKRDKIIMELINNNRETVDPPLSFDELNEFLFYKTGTYFDIIEHRDGNTSKKSTAPFTIVKKRVECRTDELIYGDPYDSLDTAYKRLCRIYAFMWLDDNGRKEYKLCAEPDGFLSCTEYPMRGEWYHKYDSPENSGIFKNCFIELQRRAMAEKKRIAESLNDTRNYHERISAKVIKNELHVFYETYNYTVPELGEYYLMDYVNGEYTLYVSYKSQFMRYYLSKQEYLDMFGKISNKYDEHYSSGEQIENAIASASIDRKEIIRLRVRAYRNAQDKINSLIDRLRSGKAHIRNLKEIYDNELDVLSYYKVDEAYQCSYDPEYGEIDGVGLDKVSFSIPGDMQVELSVDDLCAGFKIGLSTIEEVGTFLMTHKTFDLAELLTMGLVSPKSD